MDVANHRISTSFKVFCAALCAAVLAWPAPALAAGGSSSPAPQDLRVTEATYDSVSLAWQPIAGTDFYQILRNGQWVNSSYGTTATVRYLSAGTTYTLEVRARDAAGNFSAPAGVSATTRSDTAPPTTPGNLRVVGDVYYGPGLAWDASTDNRGVGGYWLLADGVRVYLAGGPVIDFLELTDIYCLLFHGETYTFKVQARDLTGNLSAVSEPLTVTLP